LFDKYENCNDGEEDGFDIDEIEDIYGDEDRKHFKKDELDGKDVESDSDDDFVVEKVPKELEKEQKKANEKPFVKMSREEQFELLKKEIPEEIIKGAVDSYVKQKEENEKLNLQFWNM
jgi:hypothetical protein